MNDEILKTNIKYLRNMSGMSQQELSKKLGYGKESNPVKDWERDRVIPESMIKKIADIFEIPINILASQSLATHMDNLTNFPSDDYLKKLFPCKISEESQENDYFKKAYVTHEKLYNFDLSEESYKSVLEAYKNYELAYNNGIKEALINMISISCLYKYLSKSIDFENIEESDLDKLPETENYSEFMKTTSYNKKQFFKKYVIINSEIKQKEIAKFISSTTNVMFELIEILKKEEKYKDLVDYYIAIMYANNLLETGYSKSENSLFGIMYLEILYKLKNKYALELNNNNNI